LHEEVYLRAYANGTEARQSLTRYFGFYNERRGAPPQTVEAEARDEVCP
jgi:hypothetical protein